MHVEPDLRKRLRALTWVMIVGLVVSGATALPLQAELDLVCKVIGIDETTDFQPMCVWLWKIREALHDVNARYPFIAYGTDWLAFGHFAIAIAFIGALRDPVRNRWLYQFGMIACALIIPYAFLLGAIRGIPFFWRLIDCSFGVFGFIPMWLCHRYAETIESRDKVAGGR